ncbi:MAG: desK 8 [Actinomycetia bacterium]|nr:desK 8 [Actinomycetes bacterium]
MDGGTGTPERGWRQGRWSWIGAGALAVARGAGLCGLAVAGLVLLLALLMPLFLAGLGIGLLVNGPAHWPAAEGAAVRAAPFAGLVVSLLLFPALLLAVRGLAVATRRLSGDWCAVPISDPYLSPPADGRGGYRERLRWLADPATRRDVQWLAVNTLGGWILAAVPAGLMLYGLLCLLGGNRGHPVVATPPAFPGSEPPMLLLLGAALIALGLWAGPRLLRGYGLLARSLLGPTGQAALALRVAHLAQTRADTIDTGAAEMRRIERDLHDGAQARLVAMGMTLDAADQMLGDNPAAARALLAEARESSAKALAELRALVRGIHPPVLADRGLAEALRGLVLDLPLRIHFASELTGRPPAPIESAAYFAVSELLANVSKHAHARQAWVDLRHQDGMLRLGVSDDGCGGADPARGTGLAGIERRLAAFDGVLALSSPPGGPTVVNMEIPCALSSPKTSSC